MLGVELVQIKRKGHDLMPSMGIKSCIDDR